jgi:hypothetical protein
MRRMASNISSTIIGASPPDGSPSTYESFIWLSFVFRLSFGMQFWL